FYYLPYTTLFRSSTLMLWRWTTRKPVARQWIDFNAISPPLPSSVVGAEDAHFCKHHGVDLGALREAIEEAQDGGEVRGASTITQQVAKNLFLWPIPGPIRKALEFPLALWIDFVLPKARVLEIYLNIAELGPQGQFAVDAASAHAFITSAATLSTRHAAPLASILPKPLNRSASTPRPGIRR